MILYVFWCVIDKFEIINNNIFNFLYWVKQAQMVSSSYTKLSTAQFDFKVRPFAYRCKMFHCIACRCP